MDLVMLIDCIYALLALGAGLFVLYGGWLAFDFHFPRTRKEQEAEPIPHLPDEVPNL